MYKIVVANQCGCFKNSNLQNNLTFESKDEALSKAIEMKNIMNHEFCKKHKFNEVSCSFDIQGQIIRRE